MMVKRVPVENGEAHPSTLPPPSLANLFPYVSHNDLKEWRKSDIYQTLLSAQTLVVSDLCLSTELVQLLNQTESIAGAAIIAHRLQDTVHLTPVLPHGWLQFLECFLYVLNYFAVYINSWRKFLKNIAYWEHISAPFYGYIAIYYLQYCMDPFNF